MTILTPTPENYLKGKKNNKPEDNNSMFCVVPIASKCRSCGRPHKARKRNAWSAAWELQARHPESQVEVALLALTIC